MTHYKVNRPDVVCEVFEDEVVVVNLSSGTYYSLAGTAAEIWNSIEKGFGQDAIVNSLADSHRRAVGEVQSDFQPFLAQLIEQKLVVPVLSDADLAGINNSSIPADSSRMSDAPYAPPALETYTDMQELLLLDPIHDVDETGWPAARPHQATGD